MTLRREWDAEAKRRLAAHARRGRVEGKEAARVYQLVKEAADGKWREFEQVDPVLSEGKQLRFFEAGRLMVVVQVLAPMTITVAAIGVDVDSVDFLQLVAAAVAAL